MDWTSPPGKCVLLSEVYVTPNYWHRIRTAHGVKKEPLGDITEILDEYKEGPVRVLLQGIVPLSS